MTYQRRIPPHLQEFLGNKATIRRSLGVDSTDCGDTSVLTAYAQVHGQVQGVISAAEAQHQQKSATIQGQPQSFPLSPRDIAGIAAHPLLEMRNAMADGRISTPIQEDLQQIVPVFLAQVASSQRTGDISQIQQALAQLTQPLLDQLGISPNETDITAITQRLLAYAADARGDVEKLQAGDWSEPTLAAKAPPIPEHQLTWAQMLEDWQLSTGGVLEQDGFGVSRKRIKVYRAAIQDFITHISDAPPPQLTVNDARKFVAWLRRDSGIAHGTQAAKLSCLKNLFKIAVAAQRVELNPFSTFTLSAPAGSIDLNGYRAFTREELIEIFTLVKEEKNRQHRILLYVYLMTGCRAAEAVQLRTTDIKQTENGCWYIDWRHEPLAEYPMLLKTKDSNNRKMLVHQRLIDEGFLDLDRTHRGRLFTDVSQTITTHSTHFKRKLLRLGIWEERKTVLHSFRNSAKDMWRQAGIPLDVRNSFTGHAAAGAGERSYGAGLGQMPDKLNEYIQTVDVSWLP